MSLLRPAFVLTFAALTACAPGETKPEPEVATDAALLDALKAAYDDARECVQIGTRPRDGVIAQAPSIRTNAGLDVLVDEGLLARELDGIALKYSLTDAIIPMLEGSEEGQSYAGEIPKLCLADVEVVEVMSFTEPAKIGESVVSNVSYSTRLTNVQPWAKAAFPDPDFVPSLNGEVRQKSSDMFLTEAGWRLQRDLQK